MLVFFHKSDLDGKSSAAIVKYFNPTAELYGIDYNDKFPWESVNLKQTIVMVDFSLDINDMIRLSKEADRLIWCDHHEKSLKSAEEKDFNPEGIRDKKFAGCELTWKYFAPEGLKIPLCIILLGRYDVWDHAADPKVIPFQYGMNALNNDPNNQKLWTKLFNNNKLSSGEEIIEKISQEGKIIKAYIDKQNNSICKSYAFEIKVDEFTAISLNTPIKGSQQFDSIYDPKKHDLMMVFCRTPEKKWNFSLYSTKDNVNCNELAQKFSNGTGGGHKGASGFSSDEFPFEF